MAIPFFQTKITRARVSYSGLSSADMYYIADKFNDKMKQRISQAKTIEDMDALPLTEKYKERKLKVTPFGIRNLWYSGALYRNMRVMRVDQNSAVIYFSAWQMAQRMAFNQRRSRQWGVSPSDEAYLKVLFQEKFRVKFERKETKVVSAA